MKPSTLTILLAAALLLAACGPAVAAATETLALTNTPEATATATAEPAATATATLAPGEVRLGERATVAGYFSVKVPEGYAADLQAQGIAVSDPIQATIMFLVVNGSDASGQAPSQTYLDNVSASFDELILGDPQPITIDGRTGSSRDVDVSFSGNVARGRFIVLPFDNGLEFYSLALSPTVELTDLWSLEGATVYDLVIESLLFDPEVDFGLACAVSSDPDYAYTQDKPVQVGGDFLEGPARARAYLNALAGPNGEAVRYERTGSLVAADGTVLDGYEISIAGLDQTVTIFVDQYHSDTMYAPDGLTCNGAFLLDAP